MKFLKCSLLLLLLGVFTSGCASNQKPDNTSQEMYDLGVECLENMQDYVDGTQSFETFDKHIDDAYYEAKQIIENENIEDYSNDSEIQDVLLLIRTENLVCNEGDTYKHEELIETLEEVLGQ